MENLSRCEKDNKKSNSNIKVHFSTLHASYSQVLHQSRNYKFHATSMPVWRGQLSGHGMLLGFKEGENMVLERGERFQIQTNPLLSTPLQRIHFKDNA